MGEEKKKSKDAAENGMNAAKERFTITASCFYPVAGQAGGTNKSFFIGWRMVIG